MKRLAVAVTVVAVLWAAATGLPAGASQKAARRQAAPAPKPDELDPLLAPIALYPGRAARARCCCAPPNPPRSARSTNGWRATTLKGSELQDAATKAGFEQSFARSRSFPTSSTYGSQMDWTTRSARRSPPTDPRSSPASSGCGRRRRRPGTLKTTPQQEVETQDDVERRQVIVIEPANPQVVYVPQYNPQSVYTHRRPCRQQEDNTADAVAAGLIGFTAGIAIGAAIDNDYYYGPYGLHGGGYMYNDAWDDYYDDREDAREDWQDHREDMSTSAATGAKNRR